MLGIKPGADAQDVRAAYRRMVKECHPDQFQDPALQKAAQEKLIQLNLAYEAALKLAAHRTVGFNRISQEELAARAELSTRGYGKIERGEVHPSLETLDKLAQATGLSQASLLSEDEQETIAAG